MSRSTKVTLDYPIETEDGEVIYRLTANVTPGYPGDFSGPIETACAPEPDEVEDLRVYLNGVQQDEAVWMFENEVNEDGLYEKILEEAQGIWEYEAEG